jgi:uncharacterized membrane protein (UPF0127 family)
MSKGPPRSTFVVENLTRQRLIASRIHSPADSASRRRGLLDIKELDADFGLWIDPCEAIHTFGMQFALDVVFLDGRLRVRKIAAHLKPNRIAFCLTARSVLEIRAGIATASGLECGDQLSMRQAVELKVPVDLSRLDP